MGGRRSRKTKDERFVPHVRFCIHCCWLSLTEVLKKTVICRSQFLPAPSTWSARGTALATPCRWNRIVALEEMSGRVFTRGGEGSRWGRSIGIMWVSLQAVGDNRRQLGLHLRALANSWERDLACEQYCNLLALRTVGSDNRQQDKANSLSLSSTGNTAFPTPTPPPPPSSSTTAPETKSRSSTYRSSSSSSSSPNPPLPPPAAAARTCLQPLTTGVPRFLPRRARSERAWGARGLGLG